MEVIKLKLRDYLSQAEIEQLEIIASKKGKQNAISNKIDVISKQQEVIEPLSPENLDDVYESLTVEDLINNPPSPIKWLVESLFPVGSLNIVGGDGGVGKSWFTMHLALCVATGLPFLNHFETKKGKVTLIDEEDNLSLITDRINRLICYMNIKSNSFPLELIENKEIKLDDDISYNKLKRTIDLQEPDLLIIDSLKRVNSADENSARDMDRVLGKAKLFIKENPNLTIIFTHHTNKPGSSTPTLRGSGDIRNIADSSFIIKGDKEKKTVTQDKARWVQKMDDFQFLLKDVGSKKTMIEYVDPKTGISIKENKNKTDSNGTKQSKLEQAKEIIIEILRNNSGQELNRKDIIKQCKDVGTNSIDNALKELEQQNVIESKTKSGGAKSFWLNNQ
jgi:RecA-family ATPase